MCLFIVFPSGSLVKCLHANARDTGLIPGSGKSPGEGNGSPWRMDMWTQWGDEEGGINWEIETDIHTPPCVKWRAIKHRKLS